ncbi:MAG: regulatory protein RecX, partial [Nocardioidaceae bacterium]
MARTILLAKLAAQPRSRSELADALAAKAVPDEVARALLDRFEDVGLVDDEAFAQAWVASRQTSRGLSRRALSVELRRKGVDETVVRDTVDAVDEESERAAARRLVDKKLRATRTVEPQARLRRLVGMLGRKGYPPSMAMQVAKEALAAEADQELP